MKVKALERIAYTYPESPALDYVIPSGILGVVEETDDAGHALVQWGELGQRWVRTESFSNLVEDKPVSQMAGSLASFAESAVAVIGHWSQQAFRHQQGKELPTSCKPENIVLDVSANGSLRANQYLKSGNCVIAVDANPTRISETS